MPNRILRDWTDSFIMDDLDSNSERFFVRLIMKVDDYGRFSSDTRLLKSNLFPLKTDIRETDITRWLAACEKSGLITVYTIANKSYLQINNFKQQLRQKTEKFPPPLELSEDDTQAHSIRIADAHLKPETETETETEGEVTPPIVLNDDPVKVQIPAERKKVAQKKESEVVDFFNATCTQLSKVQLLTEPRKKKIAARIQEVGIEKVLEIITDVSKSNFLNGSNPRTWTADFDWILEPKNFTKILEGNYKNKENGANTGNHNNTRPNTGKISGTAAILTGVDYQEFT